MSPYTTLPKAKAKLLSIIAVALVLTLWVALTLFGGISEVVLPKPQSVIEAFSYLAWHDGRSILGEATIASLTRILMASLLVVLVGVPIGLLAGLSANADAMITPLVNPFRSAPIVACLPLFVMWFGIGEQMKVMFLFSGAVIYMIPLVRDAVKAVPYPYWESAIDLGASKFELITKVILPLAAPRIFDAFAVATGILWTYITVAEYVNAGSGLGQLIQDARRFSAMHQVFAGVITIIALAVFTNLGLNSLRQKLFRWEQA